MKGTDCQPCDEAYPDCESCDVDASGKTICLRCSPPQYYPDSASSSCLECDNPSEWLNIAGTSCQSCSSAIPNCLTCTAGTIDTECSACDKTSNYFLEHPSTCSLCPTDRFVVPAGDDCDLCENVLDGCL